MYAVNTHAHRHSASCGPVDVAGGHWPPRSSSARRRATPARRRAARAHDTHSASRRASANRARRACITGVGSCSSSGATSNGVGWTARRGQRRAAATQAQRAHRQVVCVVEIDVARKLRRHLVKRHVGPARAPNVSASKRRRAAATYQSPNQSMTQRLNSAAAATDDERGARPSTPTHRARWRSDCESRARPDSS